MNRRPDILTIIKLGALIDRLRKRADELQLELEQLLRVQAEEHADNLDEILLREDPFSGDGGGSGGPTLHSVRKPTFPEGTPLNRKIMEYLRTRTGPSSYQDIMRVVPAHHQSIQNSLRNLESNGFVTRVGPNQWLSVDNDSGASGDHRR